MDPHPLFREFVRAALKQGEQKGQGGKKKSLKSQKGAKDKARKA
jgi:hypothetical protein